MLKGVSKVPSFEYIFHKIPQESSLHKTEVVGVKMKIKSKKEGKDQESIQSSTIPDPGYQWENDNFTIRLHKREQNGQPFASR